MSSPEVMSLPSGHQDTLGHSVVSPSKLNDINEIDLNNNDDVIGAQEVDADDSWDKRVADFLKEVDSGSK